MPRVRIEIIEGKSLIAKDFGGTSDPYVVTRINGSDIHRTKTVMSNLNPRWGESFVANVAYPQTTKITFLLYDYDRFSANDPMGEASVQCSTLQFQRKMDMWLPLSTKGQLHVSLYAEDFGLKPESQQPPQNQSLQPQGSASQQMLQMGYALTQQGLPYPQQSFRAQPQQGYPAQQPQQQGYPVQQQPQQGYPAQQPPQQGLPYPQASFRVSPQPQQGYPAQQPPQQGYPAQQPQQGYPAQPQQGPLYSQDPLRVSPQPQQTSYPPPSLGYPPQQGSYPPQQGSYPPALAQQQNIPPQPLSGFPDQSQGFSSIALSIPPLFQPQNNQPQQPYGYSQQPYGYPQQ